MTNLIELDGSNLSIVIQGALNSRKETDQVINSYKSLLPNAEIIISTWPAFKKFASDCSKLVISNDPGSIDVSAIGGRQHNNFNRQLLSSKEGVKSASKLFTLKVRSDLVLLNNKIIKSYNDILLQSIELNESYFKDKPLIVISNESSKKPSLFPAYLHFCDWFMLSKTQEIKKLFDMPLVSREDILFNEADNIPNIYEKLKIPKEKWSAETYMWVNYLKNYHHFSMTNEFHCSDDIKNIHNEFISDSLIILDLKRSGLRTLKNIYNSRRFFKYNFEYSYEDWLLISSRVHKNVFKKLSLKFTTLFVDSLKKTYSNYVKVKHFINF